MAFEGFPFVVGWELTLTCNLRCRHCGSSAGEPRVNELTTEEALSICDQFPSLLVQEVDFTGGEPLLRDDWPLISERLCKHGIAVNILTNGFDLCETDVAKMKKAGITGVGISLDGLEDTHDSIRNRSGSFAGVVRTIGLLQGASVPLNVITTVNAINSGELPEMLKLLKSLNVNFWRLQPLIPMGRVCQHDELQIDSQMIVKLGQFIRNYREIASSWGLEIICSDGLEYVVQQGGNSKPWRGCSAGITACGITSDGKIKGCLSMPDEFQEGDLRKDSLWDIWFSKDSFEYTRGFTEDSLGANCRSCDKATECKGGCSSSSYCLTGQFHNDALCFYKANETQESLREHDNTGTV